MILCMKILNTFKVSFLKSLKLKDLKSKITSEEVLQKEVLIDFQPYQDLFLSSYRFCSKTLLDYYKQILTPL